MPRPDYAPVRTPNPRDPTFDYIAAIKAHGEFRAAPYLDVTPDEFAAAVQRCHDGIVSSGRDMHCQVAVVLAYERRPAIVLPPLAEQLERLSARLAVANMLIDSLDAIAAEKAVGQ